jgi:hypothetical protein
MMRGTRREFPVQPAPGEPWKPPFSGRRRELSRLRACFARRGSLLIVGPAGVGKTALVMRARRELPPVEASATFYLSGVAGLQPLLRALLRELHRAGDATLRRQLHMEGVRRDIFTSWLNSLNTSRLKGAVYRSAENGQYRIVLDHTPPLTLGVAKVIKELVSMRNTPVWLLARGSSQVEIGSVAGLYWSDHLRLSLGPLPQRATRELLEWCIRRFGLARLNLEGFREEAVRLSGRNPGTLIKMCALAAKPGHQYGSQVKTRLVHIDSLVGARRPLDLFSRRQSAYDGK